MTYPIRTISRSDPAYPKRLLQLPDMPKRLFVIGSLPDDTRPTVGIVGARLCDLYGKKTAEDFGRILAANGVQIISGMAIGIDGASQKGALDVKGQTFAVLGCGADICYPTGNQTLYDQIAQTGGIISEQPCGTPPLRAFFPQRNRLISALSDVLLVVEAKSKSGSLITVDFALSQGKSIFAVPGRIGDALSDGCNRLISQGAGIACSPDDILQELSRLHCDFSQPTVTGASLRRRRLDKEKRVLSDSTLSANAKALYKLLNDRDPISSDELMAKTNLSVSQCNTALVELQLRDLITLSGLNHFLRH